MESAPPAAREQQNRRTFGRMAMRLAPALLVFGDDGALKAERVRLVDLSTTGAQVLTQEQPAVGDRIWLRLTESRRNVELTMQAEVVWVAALGERWRAGLRFDTLPRETASMLARWLFYLQRQNQAKSNAA